MCKTNYDIFSKVDINEMLHYVRNSIEAYIFARLFCLFSLLVFLFYFHATIMYACTKYTD